MLILVIAVALAGLTAFLTFHYANTADERAFEGAELVEACMVKRTSQRDSREGDDEGYIGRIDPPQVFPARESPTRSHCGEGGACAKSSRCSPRDGSFVEPRGDGSFASGSQDRKPSRCG